MQKFLVRFVLVPAVVLGLLTLLRAYLEVQSPDASVTKLVSVNALGMVWMLCMPAVMLKRGLSLGQGMLAGLLFFGLHRLVIGGVYAKAWADQWTVAGTERPVRYVEQVRQADPDASTLEVFLQNTFAPVAFGLVLLLVVWAITWAVAFRGKRPFAGSAGG